MMIYKVNAWASRKTVARLAGIAPKPCAMRWRATTPKA
ncbi:hypothetical protein [Azospirillum argentinense]